MLRRYLVLIQQQLKTNKYLETAVMTASPAQLMLMLYDGAIRFCRAGIEAIRQQQHTEANTNLLKCQSIIREFMVTLDQESPISEGLYPLYDYFIFRLIEANTKKNTEPAEEVLGYLIELKSTWLQAVKGASAATGSDGAAHG
jgi:flagellar secretion chaperone FliS